MKNHKLWTLLAVPVAALTIGVSALPAQASSPTPAASPTILSGSDSDGYVVVNRATAQQAGDATFYPTGPLTSSTLVVIPNADGSLPGGLTTAKLQALHAGAGTAAGVAAANKAGFEVAGAAGPSTSQPAAVPTASAVASPAAKKYYNWSATAAGWGKAVTGGNVIGINSSSQAGYSFSLAQGYSGNVAGSGLGYYQGYNGSVFGTWSKWYVLNAANQNATGGGFVPWGNVASTTQFKAQCAQQQLCAGTFTAGS